MNNNNFIGPFKNIAPLYIEYKKSLGFDSKSEYSELKRLDKYFYNKGITEVILTKDMVEEYGMLRKNESPQTQAKRLSLLKQFAIYLQKMGYSNIYVHHIKPSKIDSKFKPYIYSKQDLNKIFEYLDEHQYEKNSIYNCVLPILIRILYGTGIRKGEAINLKHTDVDLDKNILTIYDGKENVTRIVPISNSLSESCKTYKSKFLPNKQFFLCDSKGNKINSHITEYFQKILKKLNILRPDGTPPRLHDFRFTFAVNALEKMDKNGQDLYTTLPILCKYLGHKNIEATEYYLLLVKDYFINITDKEEKYYSDFKFLKDDDDE